MFIFVLDTDYKIFIIIFVLYSTANHLVAQKKELEDMCESVILSQAQKLIKLSLARIFLSGIENF